MTMYAVKVGKHYLIGLTGDGYGEWTTDIYKAKLRDEETARALVVALSSRTFGTARVVAVEVTRREVEA